MSLAPANSPELEPVRTPGEGWPAEPRHNKGWTRTRLFTVIALVVITQTALIFLFGEKQAVPPRPVLNVPLLKLADNAGEELALNDPTLFALPNPKDFASALWLKTYTNPPPDFRWTEPPRWLPLSADDLGAAFSRLMQTNFPASQSFNFKPAMALTTPTLPLEPMFAQDSTMRIEGELAQRQLPMPISLTNWPYADVLAPGEVQVLVDATGNVVSSVLLTPSGYDLADQRALVIARALRFTPAASLAFGRVTFNWQTVPPATSP